MNWKKQREGSVQSKIEICGERKIVRLRLVDRCVVQFNRDEKTDSDEEGIENRRSRFGVRRQDPVSFSNFAFFSFFLSLLFFFLFFRWVWGSVFRSPVEQKVPCATLGDTRSENTGLPSFVKTDLDGFHSPIRSFDCDSSAESIIVIWMLVIGQRSSFFSRFFFFPHRATLVVRYVYAVSMHRRRSILSTEGPGGQYSITPFLSRTLAPCSYVGT